MSRTTAVVVIVLLVVQAGLLLLNLLFWWCNLPGFDIFFSCASSRACVQNALLLEQMPPRGAALVEQPPRQTTHLLTTAGARPQAVSPLAMARTAGCLQRARPVQLKSERTRPRRRLSSVWRHKSEALGLRRRAWRALLEEVSELPATVSQMREMLLQIADTINQYP